MAAAAAAAGHGGGAHVFAGGLVEGLEGKAINTVRLLAADMVEKAASGHPGAPMGCAPIAHVLWSRIMAYAPGAPKWANRDRFVLSNGHACTLLYAMLHLTGYEGMGMEELKKFRQLDSVTAGHPENTLHPAIEVSTGPLGQGITNAVGLAIAAEKVAAEFNKPGAELINNFTYVLCGDGCLQEGISSEAASLAGHLALGRLIVLYDDNHITIDGETDLSFTEDVLARYASYGWHTAHVAHGNSDLDGLEAAIRAAQAVTDKPSIIKVTTTIGFGAPKKAGTEAAHGAPLGKDELKAVKTAFGFDPEASFVVPAEVAALYAAAAARGTAAEAAWRANFTAYAAAHPAAAAEFTRRFAGELPAGWMDRLPRYKGTDKADATRNISGVVLNALAPVLPELMGGAADLTPSTKTDLRGAADFQPGSRGGRYIRYGVREHAMAAVCNGMAAYGAMLPYCGTFLNFIGYAMGAVRLSALSHFRVLYVATHDSIGLGEDGPTHQPVELLEALRSTPNMYVYRPADGNETSAAYACAIGKPHSPAILALSRQNLPQLAGSSIEKAMTGGYTVFDTTDAAGGGEGAAGGKPALVIAATGSEVSLAIDAAKRIAAAGGARVAVASLPCLELFAAQPEAYRRTVLPDGVPVLTVEALTTHGWDRYGHAAVGMTTFGYSGPYLEVYKKVGITAEAVAAKGGRMIEYFASHPVPMVPLHAPKF